MTYPRSKRDELVAVAREAGHGLPGYRTPRSPYGLVLFERRPGWCARFIRQLFEAVLGLPSHSWEGRAESARGMAKVLFRAGKKAPVGETLECSDLQPGDLLFWTSEESQTFGHVALYVGNGETIENTSSRAGEGIGAIRKRTLDARRLRTISLVARVWEAT